jgi:predicted DCC family thiol-disulfide oxidoreductase YuxK
MMGNGLPIIFSGTIILMEDAQETSEGSSAEPRLATPDERPSADVVIFDGECRICTAQVRRLSRWDRGHRLAYLSLHDPVVADRYPDLTHEMLMRDMYIVDHRGRRHRGAAAVRYLSGRLPLLWWLAPLLHIPFTLPLWQWLYRQVADRRYQFGKTHECEDGTCSLHGRN